MIAKALTEHQERAIGAALADMLLLKRFPEDRNRFITKHGTKTATGIYRTIQWEISRMVADFAAEDGKEAE